MRRITIKRARTWHYRKMRPCIEQSNDLALLSPFPSWLGCIINTSGYDFRKGQDGNAVGLIAVDAVYDRNGVQLGWWYGDHLRNRNGQVVLFVSHTKIEGLMMPAEKPVSRVPTLRLRSGKPNFERLGVRPPKKHEWADVKSLLFRDQTRRTLAQIKRVWALAAERHSRTRGPKSTLAS